MRTRSGWEVGARSERVEGEWGRMKIRQREQQQGVVGRAAAQRPSPLVEERLPCGASPVLGVTDFLTSLLLPLQKSYVICCPDVLPTVENRRDTRPKERK